MNVIGRSCFFLGVMLLSAAIGLLLTGIRMTGEASVVNAVSMGDDFFEPQTITIPAGGTIEWRNEGQRPHTATSDVGALPTWDSSILRTGQTYSQAFSTSGTFAYRCELHPEMVGAIVVEAAAAPSPTATATAPVPQPTASQPGQALNGGAAPAGTLPVGGGAPPIAKDMMSGALLLAIAGGVLIVAGLFTMRMTTAGAKTAEG